MPSCSEVEALLKDVCTNGFKRKYQNERENTKEKRETLYWILHVATTVQSNWDPESHDAKVSFYLQAVHPSDMAFSLYVLDEHRDRWEISVARPAKKKRVSTSANSKSTKVYLEKIGNKICRFHDRFAKDKKSNDQKLTVEFEDWFKWMHTQMEGKITKRKKATKTTEEDSTLFDRDMFQAQVKNNPNLANWQHASATISRIGL